MYPASPLLPTIELSENSHIPKSPKKLIPATNRVPIMIGFCEREGAMALAFLSESNLKFGTYYIHLRNCCCCFVITDSLNNSISNCFPQAILQNSWGWAADLNDDALKQIKKEVEDFYLDGKSIETASQPILSDV